MCLEIEGPCCSWTTGDQSEEIAFISEIFDVQTAGEGGGATVPHFLREPDRIGSAEAEATLFLLMAAERRQP